MSLVSCPWYLFRCLNSLMAMTVIILLMVVAMIHNSCLALAARECQDNATVITLQITINLQWQWSQPAGVVVVREGGAGLLQLSCLASYRQVLLSLVYVIVLLMVVAAMAVKVRAVLCCAVLR